jgi:hypothetical protein
MLGWDTWDWNTTIQDILSTGHFDQAHNHRHEFQTFWVVGRRDFLTKSRIQAILIGIAINLII